MKPEKGAARLLVLTEAVILTAAVVFGGVRKLRASTTEETNPPARTETQEIIADETEEETELPEEEVTETPEETGFAPEVTEKVAAMTLEEKVAQMFLTSPESLTQSEQVSIAGQGTRNAMDTYPVGGIVYSDINFQGREQVGNLIFNALGISEERIGLPLFVAATTDGGGGTPAIGISDAFEEDALVEVLAAKELNAESAGVTMPVTFPQAQAAADTPWVMLTADADEAVTGEADFPCALSAQCVAQVRGTGYQGVILTDSLAAENISGQYETAEAAVLAVKAGADLIYCPENFPDAYAAVLAAAEAGEIAEEQIDNAVGRILTRKYRMNGTLAE